jgi:hypothetical protein
MNELAQRADEEEWSHFSKKNILERQDDNIITPLCTFVAKRSVVIFAL